MTTLFFNLFLVSVLVLTIGIAIICYVNIREQREFDDELGDLPLKKYRKKHLYTVVHEAADEEIQDFDDILIANS